MIPIHPVRHCISPVWRKSLGMQEEEEMSQKNEDAQSLS